MERVARARLLQWVPGAEAIPEARRFDWWTWQSVELMRRYWTGQTGQASGQR